MFKDQTSHVNASALRQMTTETSRSVPVHWGDLNIAPMNWADHIYKSKNVDFSQRISYVNNTHKPVMVGMRNGLCTAILPERAVAPSKFIIRVELNIKGNAAMEFEQHLNSIPDGDEVSHELKVIKEAFMRQFRENTYMGGTIVLDYPIGYEQLRDYGGSVYFHELDIMLSLEKFQDVPPHPFSEAGRNLQLINASNVGGHALGFGYAIRIIDNSGLHGPRWLNINKEIYKVPAQRDSTLRDGVHIVSSPPTAEYGAKDVRTKYYTFEEAEATLPLYRSSEDAVALGDLSTAKKQELLMLDHKLQVQKAELQRQKIESDARAMELERISKDHEHERMLTESQLKRQAEELKMITEREQTRSEFEQKRLRDYYESRTYERKDQSEVLKYIPSVILGIGALVLALKPLFNKK